MAEQDDTANTQAPDSTQSAPVSRQQELADKVKAKVRDALAAQHFRGNAVHKADLLACMDAVVDGLLGIEPPAPEEEPADDAADAETDEQPAEAASS